MLGAVAADTVGSIYEFHNIRSYDFPLWSDDCFFTDDSIVSFAVAEWLLTDPKHGYQTLEDAMVKITHAFPDPVGGYGGTFTRWALFPEQLRVFGAKEGGETLYESTTGRHPYNSCGNGSAMRVSAVGWFFSSLEETERVAEISAAITHNHPEGIKGAQATAAVIWMGRHGKSKEDIRSYIESKYGYDLHKTYEYWHKAYKWQSSCQGTVPQAMICFLDSTDYEDAVRKAVSLGGDSDTLACITGGMAEAFYHVIPPMLVTKVIDLLPPRFLKIMKDLQEKTDYGRICPIPDERVSSSSQKK